MKYLLINEFNEVLEVFDAKNDLAAEEYVESGESAMNKKKRTTKTRITVYRAQPILEY